MRKNMAWSRSAPLTTIRMRDWKFFNDFKVGGVPRFLGHNQSAGRGGGHALLPVEEFLGPPIYSVPQAFRQTIDMSTRIRAV